MEGYNRRGYRQFPLSLIMVLVGIQNVFWSIDYDTSEFGGFGLIIYQSIIFTPLLLFLPPFFVNSANEEIKKKVRICFFISYLSLFLSWAIVIYRLQLFSSP